MLAFQKNLQKSRGKTGHTNNPRLEQGGRMTSWPRVVFHTSLSSSVSLSEDPPLSTAVQKRTIHFNGLSSSRGTTKQISSLSHSKSSLAEWCLGPFWKECSLLNCSLPRVKYDRNEVLLIVIEKDSYCLWPMLGSRKAKFVSQKTAGASKLSLRLTKL